MNQKDFEIRYRYPLLWLDQGNRHLFSARVIYKKIESLLPKKQNSVIEQRYQALSESYFFLMGIAFENILKALIISNNPTVNKLSEFKSKYGWNNKHDIAQMIKINYNILNDDEWESINRIERYLKWVGKYPLPLKAEHIENIDLNLKVNDKKILEILFFSIQNKIMINWDMKQDEYLEWIKKE
jgi:hypothetical protein